METTGLWRLRCYSCRKTFNLHIANNSMIADLMRSQPCPHCHRTPDRDDARTGYINCHDIRAYIPTARAKPLLASGKGYVVAA